MKLTPERGDVAVLVACGVAFLLFSCGYLDDSPDRDQLTTLVNLHLSLTHPARPACPTPE